MEKGKEKLLLQKYTVQSPYIIVPTFKELSALDALDAHPV
jgi:hypothetical protein